MMVWLNDYIYEFPSTSLVNGTAIGRIPYPNEYLYELDQYRGRYAQTHLDQNVARAHQQLPWIIIWDDHEVVNEISDLLKNCFGNPSSTHSFGRSSKSYIERSRKSIAKILNCEPGEIIFNSGGTESDNSILKCAVKDLGVKHIISSKIEHHAITHNLDEIEKQYLKNTDSARKDKVFGSPSFIVNNEIFWGDDRMEDAINWSKK